MDRENPTTGVFMEFDQQSGPNQPTEQRPQQEQVAVTERSNDYPQFSTETGNNSTENYSLGSVNFVFIKSLAGILKAIEIVLGLLIFCCVVGFLSKAGNGWVFFVIMVGWPLTIVIYVLFALDYIYKLTFVNWSYEEVIFNGAAAVLFLTASIAESVIANGDNGALVAACIFLWSDTIVYGVGSLVAFRKLRGKLPWELRSAKPARNEATTWPTEQQTNSTPATMEVPPAYEPPKY